MIDTERSDRNTTFDMGRADSRGMAKREEIFKCSAINELPKVSLKVPKVIGVKLDGSLFKQIMKIFIALYDSKYSY